MTDSDTPVLDRFSLAGKVALITGASSGQAAVRAAVDRFGHLAGDGGMSGH